VPVVRPQEVAASRRQQGPNGEHGDELVIASGNEAGESFRTEEGDHDGGRHENSDLLLDDVSVSRHHAIFTRTASGRITLRDLNSLNGTYVNGARVEETALHSADEVQIGKFKLVFWEATL
jgi:pSer/pThr/pTyr-binding forkhead associated (FHA) protein